VASIDFYYVVFWNITNNFTALSSYYNYADTCKIATWTSNNILNCIDISGNTRAYYPLTGQMVAGIQINQYPISNLLYYPFKIDSNDMFLFTYTNVIYGFSWQTNLAYAAYINGTAIALS
jgi:hypothetical protein